MPHRYHFNAIVELALPGISVASLRHVIEAVSLQAADGYHPVNQAREDMRLAMIALSAHSAKTSDGHYAGDQFQLAGIPGHHVDRSKCSAGVGLRNHGAYLRLNASSGIIEQPWLSMPTLAWKKSSVKRQALMFKQPHGVGYRSTEPKLLGPHCAPFKGIKALGHARLTWKWCKKQGLHPIAAHRLKERSPRKWQWEKMISLKVRLP